MIKCLEEKNIEYEVDDLYQINFNETFSEVEYLREAYYNESLPILKDV